MSRTTTITGHRIVGRELQVERGGRISALTVTNPSTAETLARLTNDVDGDS